MEQNSLQLSDQEFIERLEQEEGYKEVRYNPETGKYYGLFRFIFTWAIVADLNETGYEDRWCYHEYCTAKGALDDWDESGFQGEPDGWHRHPSTGRRRDEDGVERVRA